MQWVQLRGKHLSSRDLFEECRRLVALARPLSLKVIVNDRADLAWLSGADGVHLGQEDLPAVEARRILGEQAIIGLSTHGLEQARQAQQSPVDYVAIGPVFPTRTKENPDPVVGRQELQAIREHVTKPLVAIGGITLENVPALFESGCGLGGRHPGPAAGRRHPAAGRRLPGCVRPGARPEEIGPQGGGTPNGLPPAAAARPGMPGKEARWSRQPMRW